MKDNAQKEQVQAYLQVLAPLQNPLSVGTT